ncbi:MAG: septal ring lytic transglycosylase RlpA family protein [Alphaproteobacteria bacterium]|nr:septal ring lytic transglycosylase RlpA family protein [Alphaproteobacteria bacterium]MBU0797067.1 septal ring lytic transglycosylase RlpA family protein [Alphaproteobacteria bacterium]MBU0887874.1 septal ring lytic transglycosylase RlpA family protein [Alphaproteobacteria bacterium]MBU1814903.1 septal ring lytic transglycosylase RlpA family protein [Alphaproteobacteria bacterium]MBU2090624.1 septal ring lytic transglycosylase RlpA family protein [Alphaproteobacteria bacterium]
MPPLFRLGRHYRASIALALAGLALAGCAETQLAAHTAKAIQGPETKTQGYYKVGEPYQIGGVWYYPAADYNYIESGIASWYGPGFDGKITANGEVYDQNDLTAAHRTLPMPSLVRVTNLENGRALTVRINDRGPFAHGRIIDLSRRSAQLLGVEQKGTAQVKVEILGQESRQLAEGAKRGTVMAAAAVEGPVITPSPRSAVAVESLSGTPVAPRPQPSVVAAAPRIPPDASRAVDGQISVGAANPGRMYVQAGAFSSRDNAQRLSTQLSRLATAQVSETRVDGQTFFRVRLGPLNSVSDADNLLEQVIGSGYPGARVVVD